MNKLILLVLLGLFSQSLFSQQESAQASAGDPVIFCSDPGACNFNPPPFLASGLEESCFYPFWAIPDYNNDESGPALFLCEGDELPSGYLVPEEQDCLSAVIEQDTYCYQTTWDNICQEAFDECVEFGLGCTNSDFCNYNADAFDVDELCQNEQWYIPDLANGASGVALFTCEPPAGYILANQCCAIITVEADAWCTDVGWDFICQEDYEGCLASEEYMGCTNPADCNYDETACVDDGSCFGRYGCTYEDACNYDFLATADDGSCEYPGCLDPEALNFNPFAPCGGDFFGGIDAPLLSGGLGGGGPILSGSCVYAPIPQEVCVGDLNGDNLVGSGDLTIFLANYGNQCGPIVFD